jgi:hypothetical protein
MQYELVRDAQGLHRVGGAIPEDFVVPENDFLGGFQYLGYIDHTDQLFAWLPFRVNLICPIYLNIDAVYLDYTDPSRPSIILPQDPAAVSTEYDDLKSDSVIVFESVQVGAQPSAEIDEWNCIGLAGTPEWLQEAAVPVCPKSGRPMRFLCQLMSFGEVKTAYTNVQAEKGYLQQYFETLNFWGDGSLYVFVEPESKVVCYTMQNT